MTRTRIAERVNRDFRADAFNIFNHPDFHVASNSTSLYSLTRSGNSITKVAVRAPSAAFGLLQRTLGSPRVLRFPCIRFSERERLLARQTCDM